MQFHSLKRVHKNKKSRQVGRGGVRGKTAGRGTKGQKARSGRKMRPEMRDIIKKLPKLRGRGVSPLRSINAPAVPVSIAIIEERYAAGETVSPQTLAEKGLIRIYKGQYPVVKILAGGDLTKKLTISGCKVSATAKAAIQKAAGMIQ